MNSQRTLTIAIMDVPYESARSTAALYIIGEALREGHNVRVLDCEAPENPAVRAQPAHARSDGTTVRQKGRSLSKEREASLFQLANERGAKLDWVNCNLETDETRAEDRTEGSRSVGPKDLVDASLTSDATVVILVPTK